MLQHNTHMWQTDRQTGKTIQIAMAYIGFCMVSI